MNRRFALFADCLLLGLFTALAAVPVVTAYPAFITACSMLREETPVGPRSFARRLRAVLSSDSFLWWVPSTALAIAAADAIAIGAGVPGAKPLTALLCLAAAATIVVALRSAGGWRPARRWRLDLLAAFRESGRDLGGSVLLLLAAVSTGAIVTLVPITALLVAGPLALAAVAIESRRHPLTPPAPAPLPSAAVLPAKPPAAAPPPTAALPAKPTAAEPFAAALPAKPQAAGRLVAAERSGRV